MTPARAGRAPSRRRGVAPRASPLPGGRVLARGAAALLVAAGCAPGRTPPDEAAGGDRAALPTREPLVRVGVAVGRDSVRASSPGGLRVRSLDPDRELASPEDGGTWTFRPSGSGVRAAAPPGAGRAGPAAGPSRRLRLRPAVGDRVVVEGRPYRGAVEVYPVPPHGLVVVNQLELETYLLGVVPVEIGQRSPDEFEAVKAQAVAARTYTVRNLGRRDSLGFDVFGNVEDQVYGGRAVERPEVTRAVRATAGEVLTWRGRPARAYYHSTGGGLTARVRDVWNLPDAPYLVRTSDRRPGGGHYCDASPRYRWEEAWTPGQLRSSVRAGLRRHFGLEAAVEEVLSVRVLSRVRGRRVDELEIRTDAGRWVVTKNDIRFFLRTPDGRVLRSTWFAVVEEPGPGEALKLRGRGYGHGVGMCQWGAIGRAREGQGYREILGHYYPGTELREAY